MKHLHITNTEKFIEPYINFVNSNYEFSEHQFFCFKTNATDHIKNLYANLIKFDKVAWNVPFLKALYTADRIYLHGLFDIRIVVALFIQPWLLRKCYWIVWGADLYVYREPRPTIKAKVKEFIRASVIRGMSGLITHIKGDYELAKEWYGVKGEYYYSFLYPSNLYKDIPVTKTTEEAIITYIQVGNSADPLNNHLEVFEKINTLKLENIRIICPLSYGDKEYAEKVLQSGKKLFGDNFEPILNFMSFDKYLNILSKVDVAIFNHNRQQAVGNITTLLGLGKKVYIREDITTWGYCIEHKLKIYSITDEIDLLLTPMKVTDRISNVENTKKRFSEKKLVEYWGYIFKYNNSSREKA